MDNFIEGAAHPFARRHVGITDGNDQVELQEIGHAENSFVRLFDVNRHPLRSETQRRHRQMDQKRRVGETVGQMRLIAPERVRAHHRAPLPPAVAQHNYHGRRLVPVGFGFIEAQRLVRIVFDLIRRMAQIVLALLFHPENEVGVVLRVSVAQLFFDLRIGNDNELPGLRVGAGHRPARDFENFVDGILRNRIGPELAHAHARLHELEQHVVG